MAVAEASLPLQFGVEDGGIRLWELPLLMTIYPGDGRRICCRAGQNRIDLAESCTLDLRGGFSGFGLGGVRRGEAPGWVTRCKITGLGCISKAR